MKIILASSSKQRQKILDMTGIKYEVITSNIPEESGKTDPSEYVKELSLNKALNVKGRIKEKAIIIALDEIIYEGNKKYEKPKTKEEAYQNLKELSGKKHTAYSGLTIIDIYQDKIINDVLKTDIYFKNITDKEIKWYVDNEDNIYNCCGYVPLGKASLFIDHVDGDYYNFLGLSPAFIYEKLKELGYNINDIELINEEYQIEAKKLRNKVELNKVPKDKPGYYKWWVEENELKKILNSKHLNKKYLYEILPFLTKKIINNKTYYYVYVGVAIKESINDRLNWHVNQHHTKTSIESGFLSTFRQSISSLLSNNQYDEDATNKFIDKLIVEYYPIDSEIKSNFANIKISKIENNEIKNHVLPLNIKDNKNVLLKEFLKELKNVRKNSK